MPQFDIQGNPVPDPNAPPQLMQQQPQQQQGPWSTLNLLQQLKDLYSPTNTQVLGQASQARSMYDYLKGARASQASEYGSELGLAGQLAGVQGGVAQTALGQYYPSLVNQPTGALAGAANMLGSQYGYQGVLAQEQGRTQRMLEALKAVQPLLQGGSPMSVNVPQTGAGIQYS